MAHKSGEQADKDTGEPIHFNEAYRRAKRNALFWATVTALIPLGQTPTGNLEVTPLVRDLAFDHALIVAISLFILAFMALGLRRAEEDIRVRNSTVAVSSRLGETAELFGDLHIKATRCSQAITGARASVEEKINEVHNELKQISGMVITANHFQHDDVNSVANDPKIIRPVENIEINNDRYEVVRKNIVRFLEKEYKRYFAETGKFLSMASNEIEKKLKPLESDINDLPKNLIVALDELSRSIEGLADFSKKLNERELSWHNWLDRYVPWAAVFSSGALAFGHLAHAIFDRFS